MRRLSFVTACLGAFALFSGCCHSHYGKCVGWNDDPYGCGPAECCEEDDGDHDHKDKHHFRRSKKHRHGHDDRCCGTVDPCCYPTDCCGPDYGMAAGAVGGYGAPMMGAMEGGVVSGMPISSGCSGCSGGISGMPMSSGGCASGNCGSSQVMPGNVFDPSSGWTISPTPMQTGSEPVAAPPAASDSIAPVPAPTTSPLPSPAPGPVSMRR